MGSFVPAAADARRVRRAGVAIDRIVIHTAQGTYRGTIAWFRLTGAQRAKAGGSPVPTATHFVVGEAGEVTQMVLESEKALHCGSTTEPYWNDRSIGIEHAGWVDDGTPPSEAQLRASAALVADICHRRRIPADRQHILGHVEVPGVTHTDPGAEWPWERYMAMVAAESAKLGRAW